MEIKGYKRNNGINNMLTLLILGVFIFAYAAYASNESINNLLPIRARNIQMVNTDDSMAKGTADVQSVFSMTSGQWNTIIRVNVKDIKSVSGTILEGWLVDESDGTYQSIGTFMPTAPKNIVTMDVINVSGLKARMLPQGVISSDVMEGVACRRMTFNSRYGWETVKICALPEVNSFEMFLLATSAPSPKPTIAQVCVDQNCVGVANGYVRFSLWKTGKGVLVFQQKLLSFKQFDSLVITRQQMNSNDLTPGDEILSLSLKGLTSK